MAATKIKKVTVKSETGKIAEELKFEGAQVEKTTIMAFWTEDEKEVTREKKEARFKSLRREAEIAVADLAGQADQAEEDLRAAIRGAYNGTAKVTELFDKKRKAKIAKKKHEDAIEDYIEFFAAEPALQ